MPTSYRSYRPGDRIIDLLMAQGQQRAENTARTWGGIGESIAGIGQQIGGALEQRRAQQAEERKAGELRARDQAIAAVFESWDGRDVSALHRQLIRHTDPKTALELAKGAESLQRLGEAPDPETAAKELLPIARGFKAASPEMRARLYPTAIRPSLIKSRLIPQEQLPEQYGPEVDQFTDYVLGMQAPQEEEAYTLKPGEQRRRGTQLLAEAPAEPPKPQPSLAEIEAEAAARARGTASVKPPGEEKLYPVDQFDPETGESERTFVTESQARAMAGGKAPGVGKGPGTAERNRMGAARTSIEAGEALLADLSNPEFTAAIGPAMGRYNSLAAAAGAGDPQAQYLVGAIKSFAALQPQIHGFRAVQMAENVEKLLSTKQTPEALAAGLRGILTASYAVAKRKPGGGTHGEVIDLGIPGVTVRRK